MSVNDNFRNLVREEISEFHVDEKELMLADKVCQRALALNSKGGLGLDEDKIIAASYYQNIPSEDGDPGHAYQTVLEGGVGLIPSLQLFNPEELLDVAIAVLEAPVEWPLERSTELSKLVHKAAYNQ